MKFPEAKIIADETLELLKPHCERIQIAGSVRREKPEVRDIEIVAIAKPYENRGFFTNGIATVVNQWEKVKGELPCKYTQRILPAGIKLDLFFATPDTWGFLLAIRTGSAEYSHKILADGWVAKGYHAKKCILYCGHKIKKFREEKELFEFLGLGWVEPKDREFGS